MSKNVAVFVDVANIFYAAKAAGVDIDYVTLLKSAIAGRDFVRAYAYTGLDPENENQRQFHAFLARSGYKVVSKDIRKYGDGKVKANLDIELVVDLMKTARNLDIAVIVSGDGDFAPAIRAVQETGVRCEVISFRGNTSSDLIEVADVFTDITQIARVEKGSSRSGRRVAAEDDLSMTEVPDKETEGAPRRRRRRATGEREEAGGRRAAEPAAVEAAAGTGNLIVLPGEKLSRIAGASSAEEETQAEPAEPTSLGAVGESAETTEARRRRRRRGGRGRGRGRGAEREPLTSLEGGLSAAEEEEEGVEYEAPRIPQHSTFGSVWDTQLGVPTAPVVASGEIADEEYEDEPEIPEYLLAERRQRSRGPVRGPRPGGRGGRGRGGAYQAAVERERYGRGGGGMTGGGMTGGGMTGGGFGGPRRDDRSRGGRGQPRPDRGPRPDRVPAQVSSSGDPWSEVPPELEELLRAELAKKEGPPVGGSARISEPERRAMTEAEPAEQSAAVTEEAAPEVAAPRRRTRRKAAAQPSGDAGQDAMAGAATEAAESKPKRRTTRRASADATAAAEQAADADAAPKPRRRSTRTATATDRTSATQAGSDSGNGEPAPEKPKRRTTRRAPSTSGSGGTPESGGTSQSAGTSEGDDTPGSGER